MPGSLHVSSKLNANHLHEFFIKGLKPNQTNQNKQYHPKIKKARTKKPHHVELNDLNV